jgi:hypothetical protein
VSTLVRHLSAQQDAARASVCSIVDACFPPVPDTHPPTVTTRHVTSIRGDGCEIGVQDRAREELEERLRALTVDVKTVGVHTSSVESNMQAQNASLRQQFAEYNQETQRQFDSVTRAIQAFAGSIVASTMLTAC